MASPHPLLNNLIQPSCALAGLRLFFVLLAITLLISPYTTSKSKSKPKSSLFLSAHGRSHRLVGLAHLLWLIVGVIWVVHPPAPTPSISTDASTNEEIWAKKAAVVAHKIWSIQCLFYDIILGILGILATLTAARSFPHRHIVNRPGESGTLSHSAMVTQEEMMEHSFYQGLNLIQAIYLHLLSWMGGNSISRVGRVKSVGSALRLVRQTAWGRGLLLWLVTLPWAWRNTFPVHSFSANWTKMQHSNQDSNNNNSRNSHKEEDDEPNKDKNGSSRLHSVQAMQVGISNTSNNNVQAVQAVQVGTSTTAKNLTKINRIYQVKKWQYVFYKHVILHGLNISVAFPRNPGDTATTAGTALSLTTEWRIFWVALNTSYVMEFFLQSMVKRGVLSQRYMMVLNGLLMVSSSIAALGAVFGVVRMEAALLSLVMNFGNRGYDVWNVMLTACVASMV